MDKGTNRNTESNNGPHENTAIWVWILDVDGWKKLKLAAGGDGISFQEVIW